MGLPKAKILSTNYNNVEILQMHDRDLCKSLNLLIFIQRLFATDFEGRSRVSLNAFKLEIASQMRISERILELISTSTTLTEASKNIKFDFFQHQCS